MRYYLTVFLIILSFSIFPQEKKLSLPQTSSIDVKGNNNIVKVIQGGSVIIYDLSDSKKATDFLYYLKSIPSIKELVSKIFKFQNKLNNIENITVESNELLKKMFARSNTSNFLDNSKFEEEIQNYLKEIENLKKENRDLRNECKDEVFAEVLRIAAERLDNYDIVGYQEIFEQHKKNIKNKFEKLQNEFSISAYLQSKNSLKNYNYPIALKQINEALELDSLNVNFLQVKGDILFSDNKFIESLDVYLRTIPLLSNDSLKFQTFNQLGRIYLANGLFSTSIEYHIRSLNILENKFIDNFSARAMTYNNLGTVYKEIQDYPKSIEFYERALLLLPTNDSINLATLYNNIALSYFQLKQFTKALKYYNKSYDLLFPKVGSYNLKIITLISNKAAVYRELKNYDTALAHYNEGLFYLEKIFKDGSALNGLIYNNISGIYMGKNEYDKALEYLFKSIKIIESKYGSNHYYLVNNYQNVATILFKKRKYPESKEFYLKALSIALPTYGTNHPYTKGSAMDLAILYLCQNKTDSASYYFNKVHFENFDEEKKLKYLLHKARDISVDGDFEEALSLLNFSIKISISNLNDEIRIILFDIYTLMSKSYCELNLKKNALRFIEKAKIIKEELIKNNSNSRIQNETLTNCN